MILPVDLAIAREQLRTIAPTFRKTRKLYPHPQVTFERLPFDWYARYSDISQKEHGIDRQFEHCEAYAERWHLLTGLRFAEPGVTGMTRNRVKLNAMLERCRLGLSGGIVFATCDRLARDGEDFLAMWKQLRKWNCEMHCCRNGHIKTAEQAGRLGGIAQDQRETFLSQGLDGRKRSAGEGFFQGGFCFGLTRSLREGIPDRVPHEARTIRYIFARRLKGDAYSTICRKLEEKGRLTKTGNTRWHVDTVKDILTRYAYAGYTHFGRTETIDGVVYDVPADRQIIEPGKWKPIVSFENFMAVQRTIKRRAPVERIAKPAEEIEASEAVSASERGKYVLSAKARCVHCGGAMVVRITTRPFLTCFNAPQWCSAKQNGFPYITTEHAVLTMLRDVLDKPEYDEAFMQAQLVKDSAESGDVEADIAETKALLSDAKARRAKLLNESISLGWTQAEIEEPRERLRLSIAALEARLTALTRPSPERTPAEAVAAIISLREALEDVISWCPLIGDDEDLVLVRTQLREVIGRVKLTKNGMALTVSCDFDFGESLGGLPRFQSAKRTVYHSRCPETQLLEAERTKSLLNAGFFRLTDETADELERELQLRRAFKPSTPADRRRAFLEALIARLSARVGWERFHTLFDNSDRAISIAGFRNFDDGDVRLSAAIQKMGPERFGLPARGGLGADVFAYAPLVHYIARPAPAEGGADVQLERFTCYVKKWTPEQRQIHSAEIAAAFRAAA